MKSAVPAQLNLETQPLLRKLDFIRGYRSLAFFFVWMVGKLICAVIFKTAAPARSPALLDPPGIRKSSARSAESAVLLVADTSAVTYETKGYTFKIDRGGKFVLQVRESPYQAPTPLGIWAGGINAAYMAERVWGRLEPLNAQTVPNADEALDRSQGPRQAESLTFHTSKGLVTAAFATASTEHIICKKDVYQGSRAIWNPLLNELHLLIHTIRHAKDLRAVPGLTMAIGESWHLTLSEKGKLVLTGKATLSECKVVSHKAAETKELFYSFTEKKWKPDPQEKALFAAEEGWSVEVPKAVIPSAPEIVDGRSTSQLLLSRRNDLHLIFDLPPGGDHTKHHCPIVAAK